MGKFFISHTNSNFLPKTMSNVDPFTILNFFNVYSAVFCNNLIPVVKKCHYKFTNESIVERTVKNGEVTGGVFLYSGTQ